MFRDVLHVLAQQGGGGGGFLGSHSLFFVVLFIMMIFMWLMTRSQQKKQKQERQEMLESLKPKDKIETVGGIYGTVKEVKGEDAIIRVDDAKDISLKVSKQAIRRRLGDKPESGEKK